MLSAHERELKHIILLQPLSDNWQPLLMFDTLYPLCWCNIQRMNKGNILHKEGAVEDISAVLILLRGQHPAQWPHSQHLQDNHMTYPTPKSVMSTITLTCQNEQRWYLCSKTNIRVVSCLCHSTWKHKLAQDLAKPVDMAWYLKCQRWKHFTVLWMGRRWQRKVTDHETEWERWR